MLTPKVEQDRRWCHRLREMRDEAEAGLPSLCSLHLPPQPVVYRSIIDDVIENIRVDFEEYGMEEEILLKLQAASLARLSCC